MKLRVLAVPVVFGLWSAFAFSPRTVAPQRTDLDQLQLVNRSLAGHVLNESETLALPTELSVLGDRIVVLDRFAESPVHVLHARTGRLSGSFGREGDGPGEFRVPRSLDPEMGGDSILWVLDPALSRVTRVDIRPGGPSPQASPVQIRLVASVPITDLVMIAEGRFMALGFFETGRLAEVDGEGRLVRTSGPLPGADGTVPNDVLQHAYQGRMSPTPDREHLVIASRHAALLEVFTAGGELVRRIEGPDPFRPRFRVARTGENERPSLVTGDDLRFGYVDVAVSQDRIYALFSGRTRNGYPGRANFGEYVHVYSLDGRLEAVLALDSEVIAIAVSQSEDRLYAIRHLPTPAIVEFVM